MKICSCSGCPQFCVMVSSTASGCCTAGILPGQKDGQRTLKAVPYSEQLVARTGSQRGGFGAVVVLQ